jgi:phospholipid-translocating ATPase
VLDVKNSKWQTIQWMELTEGQIIKVNRNEMVPADIVLLMTSAKEQGLMHVDTINLDGESSLKEKFALFK